MRIWLSDGNTWAQHGAQVRDALARALQEPAAWQPTTTVTEDHLLHAALRDVLDGPTGDYIRSHSGQIDIVQVQNRRVEVRMRGACSHCPAAGVTLHSRLESELRRRYPELIELRATQDRCGRSQSWWPTIRRR